MKARLALSTLLLALLAPSCGPFLTGCAQLRNVFPALEPEADPLVVRAEQLAASSLTIVDAFLKYEKNNRAVLSNMSLKAAADNLRKYFPASYRDLRTLTKLYKENRSHQNKALLNLKLEEIRSYTATAEVHLSGGILYPALPAYPQTPPLPPMINLPRPPFPGAGPPTTNENFGPPHPIPIP